MTLALVAVIAGATACAAPAAERATGALADAVDRSLRAGTATFDHSAWDALLRDGTDGGLVDYAFMAANRGRLEEYIGGLAAVDLSQLQRDELKALLINAYNAFTVVAILDHPGVASIRDIDGVWSDLTWEVGRYRLTLDNIEHNILRPFFEDPRIHFAVNCASRSCAPLPQWAYRAAELEEQLEERSRAFLTDPRNVVLEGGRLKISRYFDWYGDDFTAVGWTPRAESIQEFIARYATEEVRAAIEGNPDLGLDFRDYDWSLNTIESSSVGVRSDVESAEGRGEARVAAPPPAVLSGMFSLQQEDSRGLAAVVAWLRETAAAQGMLGPLFYGLAYIVFTVLLVPGSALTVGAGVTFGLGVGGLTVVLAANIGAALAFLIARYLLRERVERWLAGRQKLSAVDRAVEAQGWRVVALTRLSPVFPFNVQNYFYGLTAVPFPHYVLASVIGMLPGTLLYVYIGAAGAEVASATGGAASWSQTILLVAGLIATLAVVVLITRVARRELEKALAESALSPDTVE